MTPTTAGDSIIAAHKVMTKWISKVLPKGRKRRLALLVLVGGILIAAITLMEPGIGISILAITCPTYIIWKVSRWFSRQRKHRQQTGKGTALLICVSSLLVLVFIALSLAGVAYGLLMTDSLDSIVDTAIGEAIWGFVAEHAFGSICADVGQVVGGDGHMIELINNPDATNPTYAELVAFILEDTTDENYYIEKGTKPYICTDFAENLHNNAEAAGIRAAFVAVGFTYGEEGHALNAFETMDRGLVYIDSVGDGWWTMWIPELGEYLPRDGSLLPLGDGTTALGEWDKVAYVEKGKELGSVSIAKAESVEYEFYLEYAEKREDYYDRREAHDREMELYKQETSREVYVEGSREMANLEAWKARLDQEKLALDELAEELGDYIYEPLGIVEKICIRW